MLINKYIIVEIYDLIQQNTLIYLLENYPDKPWNWSRVGLISNT